MATALRVVIGFSQSWEHAKPHMALARTIVFSRHTRAHVIPRAHVYFHYIHSRGSRGDGVCRDMHVAMQEAGTGTILGLVPTRAVACRS